MRKIKIVFTLLIITAALFSAIFYREKINGVYYLFKNTYPSSPLEKLPLYENQSEIKRPEGISKIPIAEKEVSSPSPLRAKENAPSEAQSFLTTTGTILFTNIRRGESGLFPLIPDPRLEAAAKVKVEDMFAKQYFEHVSPSGTSAADNATMEGYQFIAIGENLALGNFKNDEELVDAWMNSPGHRANILNTKYRDIGVAVKRNTFEGHTTWLAVQIFGKPQYLCPKPDQILENKISDYETQINNVTARLASLRTELESSHPQTREERDVYNQKVDQYNALVAQYNELIATAKIFLGQYNDEVRAYNECLQR